MAGGRLTEMLICQDERQVFVRARRDKREEVTAFDAHRKVTVAKVGVLGHGVKVISIQ